MRVRQEETRDFAKVRAVNEAAFPTPAEANLVDALRERADPIISLVAEIDGEVSGHILFSPVTLDGHPGLAIMGLAPMAVIPSRQRTGIGSELVRAGLAECRRLGFGAVVVLGHPDYYPRFGFVRAVTFGIESEYVVPEEAFMAIELQADYLDGVSGTIRYHEAFAEA